MRCIEDWCKEQAAKNQSLCAEHLKSKQRLKPCRTCGGPLVDGGDCRACWKSRTRAAAKDAPVPPRERLTATQLGAQLALKGVEVNEVMIELGWLTADRRLTALGTRMGGSTKQGKRGDFALWPAELLENKFFTDAVKRRTQTERERPAEREQPAATPGEHLADDGHYVRSKGELLIDNWLYQHGILHAYERPIPGQDELTCDFFLPGGNVFIEFWGRTGEPFVSRMKRKQAFYAEHRLRLIELESADLKVLDATLTAALRRFGVQLRSA